MAETNFKLNYSLRLAKSGIHGVGAFTEQAIPARKKIGSMGGTIISEKAANAKAKTKDVLHLVEYGNGKTLDGTKNGNALSHVNHSCVPNSYIRILGWHVEFYALKKIKAGEEITCDYGITYHDGKLRCGCGAKGCKGFL